MSLCKSDTKNQVENMNEYTDVREELDTMKLLSIIKKQLYTGGTNDFNESHNKVMAQMNLMNVYQDMFQGI